MPTAAKVFGALSFCLVCFLAAQAVIPALPKDTQIGYMPLVSAAIGLVCGWMVSGTLAGRGFIAGLGTGVRSSVTCVIVALLVFGGREMILRSINHRYRGPMEALQGMAGIMLDYGRLLLNPNDLVILVAGGALAGAFVEWTSRQWR